MLCAPVGSVPKKIIQFYILDLHFALNESAVVNIESKYRTVLQLITPCHRNKREIMMCPVHEKLTAESNSLH